MTTPDPDAFVRYVLDRAGEVVRYDADSSEVVFLRDDVADAFSPLAIETVLTNLRREGRQAGRQEHLYAHGTPNCVVRYFDDGLEFALPV